MKHIALVGMIAFAGTVVADSDSAADAANGYDRMYEPAPQARLAEQAALIGVDQYLGTTVTVGDFGTVLLRQDTGWQQQTVPTSVLLTSVHIVNEDIIWATGHDGMLLRSENGGVDWDVMLDGYDLLEMEYDWLLEREAELELAIEEAEDEFEREDLEFELDELFFHIGGAEIQFDVGPTKPFLDIHFVNESVGLATAAYGTLLRTEDGGESWELITGQLDNPMGFHINKLLSNGNGELLIVGESGLMARSHDAGESWEMLDSPYHGSLFGALYDQQGQLWVFGLRGNLFVSSNGGDYFEQIHLNTRYNLNAGTVLADGRVVVVGHSGLIVVLDPETLEFETYEHHSNTPLTGVRQGAGNELILVGRAGIQQFMLPVSSDYSAQVER